jgi:hypothetical protein
MLFYFYILLLLSVTLGKKEVEKGRSSTTTPPPPDDPLAQVNSSVKTIVGRPRKYLEQIFRNDMFQEIPLIKITYDRPYVRLL